MKNYDEMTITQLRAEIRSRGGLGIKAMDFARMDVDDCIKVLRQDDRGELPEQKAEVIPAPVIPDLTKLIAEAVAPLVKSQVSAEDLEALVDLKIEEKAASFKPEIKIIEHVIKRPDAPDVKLEGAVHPVFFKIMAAVQARTSENRSVPIMLVGGAGGAKTSTVAKVAEALGLKFYPISVSETTMPSAFFGFINASGSYVRTSFREACEFGGVYLLDEFDAGNANASTALNAATSNGECGFPDGTVKKHKDFVMIAAGNTFGRGSTGQYCGRNRLDAATMDRFAVINFDYDPDFEMEICTGVKSNRELPKYEYRAITADEKATWVSRVQYYRRRVEDLKIQYLITPRASIYGCALLEQGFSMEEVSEMVLWKGINSDVVRKIKGE
jgi:cobaltochelatase CobS